MGSGLSKKHLPCLEKGLSVDLIHTAPQDYINGKKGLDYKKDSIRCDQCKKKIKMEEGFYHCKYC